MKDSLVALRILLFHTCLIFSISCNPIQPEKDGFLINPNGLRSKVLREGTGDNVRKGQEILLHEKMFYLNDSLLFDSRTLPGPVKVLIGADQVIKGIDQSLVGMKKGEIKKLIVPPDLSQREGNVNFPHPDSTLIYEIELLEILP